jgi:hypothetical protein
MFYWIGEDVTAENITFGNYCSTDLVYQLKPELSRKRRTNTNVQASIGIAMGDRFYFKNCRFIGRAHMSPFVGAYRTLYENCEMECSENGLNSMVTDSGFNKRLPANCILAQSPGEGTMVKEGHMIYVTVNSPSSPSFAIPDVIDNSSYREAEAKLTALGFKLLPPKVVMGEKDWVYGILSRGRRVSTGDMVSIDSPLTLMIGSGTYDQEDEELDYVEPEYRRMLGEDVDEFEEVTEP